MSYSEIRELIQEHGYAAALELLVDSFYASKREMEEAEKVYKAAKNQASEDSASIQHFMLAASRDHKGEAIEDGYVVSHVVNEKVVVIKQVGEDFTVSTWPKLLT